MLEGYSLFQASWLPSFLASKHFFVFCHLSSLSPAANPFFPEFFHHQLLHVTLAMAGHKVPMTHGCKQGLLRQTAVHRKGTSCMKPAASGGINGAGNVSGQNDTSRLALNVRGRDGR